MTFSIAGRCARTGQLGAVVTTSGFASGSRVPWAQAGVGAALTQHRTDPRLGPKMLAALKAGKKPDAIMAELKQDEPGIGWRQLAVIAADGNAAYFNGHHITSTHKGRVGKDCVSVGNIIRRPDVVDAMIESFESKVNAEQPLAERLLRAIEAGHAAGGEWKQEKSAALIVAHKESFPWVDLRVDFDPRPLDELRFLWENYQPMAEDFVVRACDPDNAAPPV